jgi:hypothetical protein
MANAVRNRMNRITKELRTLPFYRSFRGVL